MSNVEVIANLDLIDVGYLMREARRKLTGEERLALAAADNFDLVRAYEAKWPMHKLVPVNSEFARVDGVIVNAEGKVIAVYEAKTRTTSYSTLTHDYKNEWLVSADKITCGVQAARAMDCPFIGILYLVPDKTLIRVKIWSGGEYTAAIRYDETETDAGVRGGIALRNNGFIDLSKATVARSVTL